MPKSTNVDKEVIEEFFDRYLPVVEAAIEQKVLSDQQIEALCGNFFDLLERKDPLSKQIVEITCDHMPSLYQDDEKTFHN